MTEQRAGDRRGRAHGRRARPARHGDQQRGRDAARPGRRRADRGVGADGRAQRERPALRRPRGAPASPAARPRTSRGGCADLVNVSSVAGRRATLGCAVYNATKFARRTRSPRACARRSRSGTCACRVVEPGAVATELVGHNRAEIREAIRGNFELRAARVRGHRGRHRLHRHARRGTWRSTSS